MLWNGSGEGGNVRGEFEGIKTLAVKMETVTVIGKGSENVTCCVY